MNITRTKLDAFIDATSIDMLADIEEDLDHGAKARRLRAKAKKVRAAAGITEEEYEAAQQKARAR